MARSRSWPRGKTCSRQFPRRARHSSNREGGFSDGPTDTAAWRALQSHYDKLKGVELRRLFAEDPRRGETFVAEGAGLYLDFSKNRITAETLGLLIQLARECGVSERRDAMFRGEKIN